jgi:manganese/zinc/iron transport system substrate-binding protein
MRSANIQDKEGRAMSSMFCLRALMTCLALAWWAGIASPARAEVPHGIVATTAMVGDLVGNVAGDRANVRTLMGSGVDPHLYKPTRDDVASLRSADAIFYSGLMLEGKMADTLIRMARTKPVYAVTELLDESKLLSPEDLEGHFDPHVWMDVAAWSSGIDAVARALAEFDPTGAETYHANARAYAESLAKLDAYARASIATIPADQRVLITSHDAFGYLGRAYGLTVMGVQGLSTESEAGLQRINELVDFVVDNRVRAVFVESSVSPKSMEALIQGARSRGHELAIGGELFSDAMGEAGTYEGTYIGMIDHNITLITRALGGSAPADGMQSRLSHAK